MKIPYKYRKLVKNKIIKGLKILILLFLILTLINNFSLDFLVKNTSTNTKEIDFKEIKVDPCNISSRRKANVKVDIGYGDRNYYSYTNQYGQVVKVEAKEILLQLKDEENLNKRYCEDEAKVKGTEQKKYDEGHIIADSLGGVSNAYNITPENSYLNRKGKQYQMEDYLRKQLKENRKITNFKCEIKYDNKFTFIPSSYSFSWENNGIEENVSFENK